MGESRPRNTRKTTAAGAPLGRGSRAVAIVALWGILIAGAGYGLTHIEDYARSAAPGDTRLEWADLPAWLSDQHWRHALQDVERGIPDFGPRTAIYDDSVCQWVAYHVAQSPWIANVERVAKTNDRRVRVYAAFRKPFTLIESQGRAYLVDQTGVRLPTVVDQIDYTDWITIRGAHARPPSPGEKWPGDDVEDALKLADFLYRAQVRGELPVRRFLRSVDLRDYPAGRRPPGTSALRLVTITDIGESSIYWGIPPGAESGVEATAERKLAAICNTEEVIPRLLAGKPADVRSGEWVDFLPPPRK